LRDDGDVQCWSINKEGAARIDALLTTEFIRRGVEMQALRFESPREKKSGRKIDKSSESMDELPE
jgi:hypothetical protein